MRLIALLLLLLLMFAGAASAGDYYVSTTGDNTTQGNITHPWQNVSYATQQATAGDTIHLFDGIWYDEHAVFANSGNATHPITLTAYNGTPELDGVDRTGTGIKADYKEHIEISHLEIHHYYYTIDIARSSYSTISDCELYNTSEIVVYLSLYNSTNNTIKNCTLYDSGWNTVQLCGNRCVSEGGSGIPATYITVQNCTLYNNGFHGAVDIYGCFDHVDIIGNTFHNNWHGGIFNHDTPDHQEHITIQDNIFQGLDSPDITPVDLQCASHHSTIHNNTFYDYTVQEVIWLGNSSGTVISENYFYNCTGSYSMRGNTNNTDGLLCDGNYIEPGTGSYCFAGYCDGVVVNPLGKKRIVFGTGSSAELKFDEGHVFTASFYWADPYVTPRYYPDKSNCSAHAKPPSGSGRITVTDYYNITLVPTYAYLKDVTVNYESDASDDRTNISADSSVSTNPTWINATMQNTSNTYNVSVDGGYVTQVVSDANKIVRYHYTSLWSAHTFEFDWFSATGFSGAPDPTNIANTTGETWVRHSWSAGSGNITDSYNVSVNSIWHNITNAYYNNTGLSAEDWSNVTVWAYNNTGGISQNSISQNTQSDAAAWSPSDTAMYYNTTSTIMITTKTDGTNLFSRTPTEADGNATSGRLVVKTT